MSATKSALFVCLAEAVFQHIIEDKGLSDQWKVDSAGLGGWHAGNLADLRARTTLKGHNIQYDNRARQITETDFLNFDYIFGMDEDNIASLEGEQPSGSKAKIFLLGDFDPEGDRIIRDPYYDRGSDGFEKCYQQCVRSCNAFLDSLEKCKV